MSDMANICDRITRLTLGEDLPRDIWSELCLIDSDLRAAKAASAERVRGVVRDVARQILRMSALDVGLTSSDARPAVIADLCDRIADRVTSELAGATR